MLESRTGLWVRCIKALEMQETGDVEGTKALIASLDFSSHLAKADPGKS